MDTNTTATTAKKAVKQTNKVVSKPVIQANTSNLDKETLEVIAECENYMSSGDTNVRKGYGNYAQTAITIAQKYFTRDISPAYVIDPILANKKFTTQGKNFLIRSLIVLFGGIKIQNGATCIAPENSILIQPDKKENLFWKMRKHDKAKAHSFFMQLYNKFLYGDKLAYIELAKWVKELQAEAKKSDKVLDIPDLLAILTKKAGNAELSTRANQWLNAQRAEYNLA